jgi:ribosome biogenesis protein ENP2
MQVSCPTNDVKIYNLSAGKTLPEWISARKRRRLAQRDVDIRQRIELVQDFDMPDVSNCVEVSRDGQYLFAAGKSVCAVHAFDSDAMTFKMQSSAYTKTYSQVSTNLGSNVSTCPIWL